MSKGVDLTGKRFGRLTVIERAGKSKSGRNMWTCKCDCGNSVTVLTTSLTSGRTKSCGCYHKERVSATFKKHGQYGTRLYRIWSNMIQRCENPKNDNFSLYGAKGICVCDQWKVFSNFYEWALVNGYSDNLSIDRMDNEKGYSPENCRWATPLEQTVNRRCVRYVEHNGKRQNVKDWAREAGIDYRKLLWRIQHGWPIEKALELEQKE